MSALAGLSWQGLLLQPPPPAVSQMQVQAWTPMNNSLLWAAGAALVIVLVLAVALWRRRKAPKAEPRPAPAERARTPGAPPAMAKPPATPAGAPLVSAEAQRLAASDALRHARRRKSEEAARQALKLEAQAQAQAQAKADARARKQADADAADLAALARIHAEALASPQQQLQARPLEQSRVQAASIAPAAPRSASLPRTPPPVVVATATSGPPTVLLADDSKVVRVKTGRLLEKQGWRVLLAEDGETALKLLSSDAPDLLITDVEMPGIDGFELTRQVRRHPRWGRLPVIMITSSDEKHRADAHEAGVNLLMGKPYAEADLLAQAQRLLGRRLQAGAALH